MKKRIFSVVLGLLFIGLLAFNFALTDSEGVSQTSAVNLEIVSATAMAQGEGGCPNGCYSLDPKGCFCYTYYPDLKEYEW